MDWDYLCICFSQVCCKLLSKYGRYLACLVVNVDGGQMRYKGAAGSRLAFFPHPCQHAGCSPACVEGTRSEQSTGLEGFLFQ